MEKTGRNEPCPCGSGKKYKNCHQQQAIKESKNKSIIIGSLIVAFVILAVIGFYWNSQSTVATQENAPKGKVWSPEHGHWHNAE